MKGPKFEASTKGRRAYRQSDDEPVEVMAKSHVMTGNTVSSPGVEVPGNPRATVLPEKSDESRTVVLSLIDRGLALLEQAKDMELGYWDRLVLTLSEQVAIHTANEIQHRVGSKRTRRGGNVR